MDSRAHIREVQKNKTHKKNSCATDDKLYSGLVCVLFDNFRV